MKLDARTRALIAVGASVAANCQPCLLSSACTAMKCGAGEQEIADAIEIARIVIKCTASNMDKFVAGLNTSVPSQAGEPDGGCGCRP